MSQHILLSTEDPGVGGVAQYNHSLLCGLVKLGYRVTCLQPQPFNNRSITYQKQLGIQHLWLDEKTVQNLSRILTKPGNKPDLIVCSNTNPFANLPIKQIAIQLSIPYIVVEGLVEPHLANHHAAYLNELSHQYIKAKSVIAVSFDNLNLLHSLFRLPKSQGQVIYYGRPSEYFTACDLSVRENLRQALSIPSDAVVCFTAARIENRKGYQYQLEAIKQLIGRAVWTQLYFVWAGAGIFDPQLETELKEAIGLLGINKKVIFLGQRSDVSDWLNAADIFVFPSLLEGMPLCVMEAMAKGLPVIASAVSGIPEELGETGKLLTDPKLDPQATVRELVTTIENWVINPQLRQSIGQACKKRAEALFREERMIKETVEIIEQAFLPHRDYVSPGFKIIRPDQAFPNMIAGDTSTCGWTYLRREIPHNWYVDKRQTTVGFLSRDEAHILYNTALMFKGKKALEIGCWLGWSACHIALAGVELDVIDPLLGKEEIYKSVSASLDSAGVLDSVNLIAGYSPQKVIELAEKLQRKWSLIFIDGDHEAPGPLNDAIICEQLAEGDALILFHDLSSPDVAKGLDYFKQKGWNTMVYQTMQIMGVAWRGNVEPVKHQPDPRINWNLPKHLEKYCISNICQGLSSNIQAPLKQEQTPLISVVIPCYNQAQFLPEAVASVVAQTYDNWEIIIVNDGSPDNTSEVAKQLIAMYSPNVRLIEQENSGLGSARNTGIDTANGEYILPLDADDKLSSNAIALLLEILLNQDQPCIAFGSYQMFGIDQRVCISVDFYSFENIKRFNMLHPCSLYPKQVWELLNGYKVDRKRQGYEDWEFWLNCHKHKIPFHGTREIVVYYRRHFDAMIINATQEKHEELYARMMSYHPEFIDDELIENNNKFLPAFIIDGVFFQLNTTGIARVWTSLLKEWVNNGFAKHIVVLDRAGTAPKISGIKYRAVPLYDYNNTDADREMLQQMCDEEGAEVFISSYYTTPTTTPSVFIAHDMIPETMGWDISNPMWREKHQGIQHASQYIAVSEHTARDLVSCFPEINRDFITVAHCGVESAFSPANVEEINNFKNKYGITKPYFMVVGIENNYKNSILFFQAFSQLASSSGFDIVCTGNRGTLAPEFRAYTLGSIVHILQLSDDELVTAYSGAVALAYPSKYEGFGLPIVEAMACGCPVITCPNASIPEVAGEAAIYVNDDDVDALANALFEVQKPGVRNSLIAAGLAQAKKFSWSTMARTVSTALINTTILHLNLKETNLIIFPDWSQPEELISLDLERVIKTLAEYSDSQRTTLLIDTSDISSEDAAIFLSGLTMNLLLQEDIDLNEGLEISFVGNLADIQWTALLPRISARIILEYENKQAVINWQQMLENANNLNGLIEQCEIKTFIQNYQLNNNLYSLVAKYQQENSDISVLKELRLLRKQIAESWLDKEENLLEKLYLSKFGEAHQALLNSGIQNESLIEAEQSFVTDILAIVAKGLNEQNAIQYLLVAMLYCPPHQLPLVYDLTQIPSWLLNDYLKFTFKSPLYFKEIGEADNYYLYMENLINYLHINIISHSESKFWQDIAAYFTHTVNLIPLYFNKANLKNIYTKRADIIKLYLQEFSNSIEYEFPTRLDERTKIRVGILASHFEPQTETFAALSVYKHLNRDVFEVILFTLNISNHRLERYCTGHADALIKLPTNLENQVQTIREADLDILFISTNVTAVTHQITLLSLYRLARIQMVDANSPVTTGMPHIDYYIASKLSETEENAQQHYTEKLITLDSPPQCFDFGTEEKILATTAISRESLGITKTTVVYVSGANYYKIIPEQEVTWAKIIASVPNSVLLLYPFNPNWSSSYPCIAFRKRIITTFAKYGLGEDRLLILDPAPNRADVKKRLKLCDIYLDSYPYSGMTSLIDPLEVGLPTVVMETEPSRSRKGASLLRELQIFDLITNSQEAYIQSAVALGINFELRQQKAEQIQQKMHQNPTFLDSRSHSAQMGELFQELFYKHQAIALKEQLNLKDINLIIFPDWLQPEDLLYQDLASVISTLTTHPNKSRLTLLIDTHNVSEEEADMLLSSLTMNLLMEGDVDITEGPEISLLGKISDIQWKTLLSQIHSRIALRIDNQQAIAQVKAENLPFCDVDSLIVN